MKFLLGIHPPQIANVLLPIVLAGVVGFLLCYWQRFLTFVILPAFIWFCATIIQNLEFFTSLTSPYMLVVYLTMLLSGAAIIIGSRLGWQRAKLKQAKLP